MKFDEIEMDKFKKMLLYAIQIKAKQTQGHNGFNLKELQPILDELESEGKIKKRDTVGSNCNSSTYFT